MKIQTTIIALVLGLTGAVAYADPITVGNDFYLGSVTPGDPANPAGEAVRINMLTACTINTTCNQTITPKDYTIVRSDNVFSSLPTADATGSVKVENGVTTGNFGAGWTYLLAKYGNTDHVWYVGNETGAFELLGQLPEVRGSGLSHYSLYNPGTSVPDGGMTLMLLGGALVGLESLRRKLRS